MNGQAIDPDGTDGSGGRAGAYLAVLLVEALVIAGLYLFGRHFSA